MKKVILFITAIVAVNTMFSSKAFGHSETSAPAILSEAAIVIDSKTGTVLYDKNSDVKMYPASLTKIATAVYAIEAGDLGDVVTVSSKARNIEGTRVYLEEGEQVTLKKLLQGLLINSGNDAGVAIAEHLSGSVESFSSDINNYLKNVIGVQNSNFQNPHGLFNPNHVTTAEDLAKITQYAMKNQVFREIFGTKELKWGGESWDTTIYTHHKLMRENVYKGVTGGKTGYVDQSGFTLATTAKRENLSLIVITLNSNSQSVAYNDTINLLDYGFDNFKTASISKGSTFTLGEKAYKASKKVYFTQSINAKLSKEVKEDGILEVLNQEGTVIASFPLDKIRKKNNKTIDVQDLNTKGVSTGSRSILGEYLPKLVFVAISIALSIFGIFHSKIRRL